MDPQDLERKMAEMKRRNEEILRRHAEIEADKKEADALSALAAEKMKQNPKSAATQSVRARLGSRNVAPATSSSSDLTEKTGSAQSVRTRFISRNVSVASSSESTERDIPPDPKYGFLSDPSRTRSDSGFEQERNTSGRGYGARHRNNFGGSSFGNVKTAMKQGIRKPHTRPGVGVDLTMEMSGRNRRQYQEWKQNMTETDQQRIERQKTSEGTWKREWDRGKVLDEEYAEIIPPVERVSTTSTPGNIKRTISSSEEGGIKVTVNTNLRRTTEESHHNQIESKAKNMAPRRRPHSRWTALKAPTLTPEVTPSPVINVAADQTGPFKKLEDVSPVIAERLSEVFRNLELVDTLKKEQANVKQDVDEIYDSDDGWEDVLDESDHDT